MGCHKAHLESFWPGVQEACHQFLRGGIEPSSNRSDLPLSPHNLVGQVSLIGPEHWAVSLSWPRQVALAAAVEIFLQSPDDITGEDLCDLTGELTNLVAGQLQSCLSEGTEISLPVVVCDAREAAKPKGRIVDSALFTWRGGGLEIRILCHKDIKKDGQDNANYFDKSEVNYDSDQCTDC